MKLLGDDCWWAPRWMKRIQERLGLGETELPDERKRPAVREPEEALVGAGAPTPPRRPPHDPTHPAAEGASRPGATTRIATPPRASAPSSTGTTRIPTARPQAASSDEPQTTRLSMAKNAVRNVVNNATGATQRRPAPPPQTGPREEREIESWLGELRGSAPAGDPPAPPPPARPSADATRAMPDQRQRPPRPQPGNEPTTAIPAQGPPPEGRGGPPADGRGRPQNTDATTAIPTLGTLPSQGGGPPEGRGRKLGTPPEGRGDADAATEKLNTREDDERKRGGGGLSAQDLLRREGRY
jgi:RND superfamily putative drug exporter